MKTPKTEETNGGNVLLECMGGPFDGEILRLSKEYLRSHRRVLLDFHFTEVESVPPTRHSYKLCRTRKGSCLVHAGRVVVQKP